MVKFFTQQTFTRSKSVTIETVIEIVEKDVEYVQS